MTLKQWRIRWGAFIAAHPEREKTAKAGEVTR